VIQCYAPTADKLDKEIEDFYKEVDRVLRDTPKQNLLMITGDFNARVEDDAGENDALGKHGHGQRNDGGQMLVDFSTEYKLFINGNRLGHAKEAISSERTRLCRVVTDVHCRNIVDIVKQRPCCYYTELQFARVDSLVTGRKRKSVIQHFDWHICLMFWWNNTVFRHKYTTTYLVKGAPIRVNNLVAKADGAFGKSRWLHFRPTSHFQEQTR